MKFKVMALALLVSATSFAQIDTRDLDAQYNQAAQNAASGPVDMYDVVQNWCDDAVVTLQGALGQFQYQVMAGNNVGAFQALQSGLNQVRLSRSFAPGKTPFVRLASERALMVSSALQRQGRAGDLGALHALESLTRNVINVAYRFDTDYYVPYVYRYSRNCSVYCNDGFIERMQRQALSFASNQIESVLSSLTTNVDGDIRPVGHASVYLTTAEIISVMTADDLNRNIFASRIPCTISELRRTGLALKAFNGGQTGVYGSVPRAVSSSAYSLQSSANNIDSSNYCTRW